MPGKNLNPLLGWHPPAELSAWIRQEAADREIKVSTLMNEIVLAYIALLPPWRSNPPPAALQVYAKERPPP